MKEIKLSDYATKCITLDKVAERIYNDIVALQPLENEIVVDMTDIITLSCQCINILFGQLYDFMGADKFHENLLLKGCNDTLGDFIAFMLKERLKNKDNGEGSKNN